MIRTRIRRCVPFGLFILFLALSADGRLLATLEPDNLIKGAEPPAEPEKPQKPLSEAWDYAPGMKQVATKFRGKEGVVLHIGDSMTIANPYGQWARQGKGKTPEDEAILKWMHTGANDKTDGWWLCRTEVVSERAYTSVGGMQSTHLLAGGNRDNLPLEKTLKEFNPQMVVLMVGIYDADAKRAVKEYKANMAKAVDLILDNGTICIPSTVPPLHNRLELTKAYNEALRELAKERGLPLIDLEKEILTRRPDDWNGTLQRRNNIHLTAREAGGDPTAAPTAENLGKSGYHLRGWLSVQKIAEVKRRVLDDRKTPEEKPKQPAPAFPLKTADGGRYLVDQKGVPFLIAGESPQALMVNLSAEDAELFFANRQSHGFNAVWINLLCRKGTGGRADGSTYDGLLPFEQADDFTKPKEAYFARCDRMIRLAEKHGMLVILDPCETIDHLKPMLKNGPKVCREFGRYLGDRYKNFDNILWLHGNDFQTWKDAEHDAVVTALALGIKDKDTRHLHTVELNYLVSGSRDDARWASIIHLSAAYTYYPPYAQVLKDYNRQPAQPVVMIEADYEFERDSTPAVLRRQEYWSLLSGAAGQLYGNRYTWPFKPGWKEKLDTPGAKQMAHVQSLFGRRAWHKLIPDQKHTVVIAGYGTFDDTTTEGNRYVMTSDYVTAGRTPDGTLVMAYLPSLRTIKVDMAQLAGPAAARWYDPSRGTYTAVKGSPLPNTGKREFTPPGNNADGDGDWVLVLETTPPKGDEGR